MERCLAITTKVGCKNQCAYCPQDSFINSYVKRSKITQMNLDCFQRCMDNVPADVHINFAGFGEPWLNPDCTEMLLYAHAHGFKLRVYTTLVGMELSDIYRLREIPFINFVVHLPEDKGQTKISVNEKYLSVLSELVNSSINNVAYILHRTTLTEKVHRKVKHVLIQNNITPAIWDLVTRAGNVKIAGMNLPEKIKGSISKCFRLKSNILLPNGDVALCCMDWGLQHILGNLLVTDYDSLFEGEEYAKIVRGLDDDSSDILCRYCDIAPKNEDMMCRISRYFGRLKSRVKRIGKNAGAF